MGKIIGNNRRKWIEIVILPVLLVAVFFAIYSWIGYERELQWHSLRKGLEAIAILVAVSVLTQCSLKEKLWHPSYLVLFMYALIYPIIISIGRKGWITDFDFAAPYFLIAVSAASLITVFLYTGQASWKLGYVFDPLATFFATLLFLNTVIYVGYFCVYSTPFVAADMLAVIQTNAGEARQFIEGQIGLLPVLGGVILTISFAGMFTYLVKLSTHTKAKKSNAVNSNWKKKLLGSIIVLLCGYLICYWGGKSYPYNEYRMAKNYIKVVQRAQKEHGEAVKKLHLSMAQTKHCRNIFPARLFLSLAKVKTEITCLLSILRIRQRLLPGSAESLKVRTLLFLLMDTQTIHKLRLLWKWLLPA